MSFPDLSLPIISNQAIIYLLMAPVFAMVIAFARQIIGIKGFGIYIPLILSFAFLATNLKVGLIIFISVLLIGSLMRLLLKKVRLLYLPRMSLVVVAATLIVIFSLWAMPDNWQKSNFNFILALVAIVALSEKFISVQIERGPRIATVLILQTVLLAIICYFIGQANLFRNIVASYPIFIILGLILINILLGRWTGLRLSEYWRFKEVIRNIELPKKK